MPFKTGVLIVNLGTPDEPTAPAVKRYLKEFLWDKRVVSIPRPIWWLILNGIVLRQRPQVTAKNYRKIWLDAGSPLLVYSQNLVKNVAQRLPSLVFELGMRYGNPSLSDALERLRQQDVRHLLIVPLYPQYSTTTTASVYDAVMPILQQWVHLPDIHFITEYYQFPPMIQAVANSIEAEWRINGRPEKLLFSFHGLPERLIRHGDPYYVQCRITARLIAEAMALPDDRWFVAFQSRFGREPWLQPYTDKTLQSWGQQGVKHVGICCPGFPVDCLETLEEIAVTNRDLFLESGGEVLNYLPALNDSEVHSDVMEQLILSYVSRGCDHQALSASVTLQYLDEYRHGYGVSFV